MATLADAPQFLTPDEVAERTRLHPETIRRMIRDKRLPAVKIGRGWRVDVRTLSDLVKEATKDQ